MANDYLGLIESLNAPIQQRQAYRRENQDKAMAAVFNYVRQRQTNAKIKSMVKEAEAKGYQVEYSINPETGQVSPTIKSKNEYGTIFEALKNPEVSKSYEMGRGSKGEPRLIKKKTIKPEVISGIKSILSGEKNTFTMKNPATGEPEDLDISDESHVGKAMEYLGVQDWRNNPEMIEEGIPGAYDGWSKKHKERVEAASAASDAKVQPMGKGLASIGAGAKYKDASKKYGENTAKEVVNKIVALQKQGKSLKQIRELMEEDGRYNPDLFLKPYGK